MKVDGKPAHFGQPVGAEVIGVSPSELGGGQRLGSLADRAARRPKPLQHAYGDSFVRYFLAQVGSDLDASKFDFDKDMAKFADARALLNATDPDLGAFRARGGKLLMYFGWADTALPPLMGDRLLREGGGSQRPQTRRTSSACSWCPACSIAAAASAPTGSTRMTALINWVENGIAPATITASQVDNGKVVRTRPLCPYPQVARYSGSGSPDDAANFACKAPE